MLTLKKKTAEMLAEAVKNNFGDGLLGADEIAAMLEYPPDRSMGDIALPCFRLSKTLRRSPRQIAEMLAAAVGCEEFSSVTALNGYLNFKIDGTAFAKRVVSGVDELGDKYGSPMDGTGKTVVLDYSSPNVAKPFHIGHLGTTVIGHSLKLLHEFAGYKCIGINYLGSLFYQCFMRIHRSVFVRSACQCVCRHGMSDVAAVNIFVQYHRDVFGKLYVF